MWWKALDAQPGVASLDLPRSVGAIICFVSLTIAGHTIDPMPIWTDYAARSHTLDGYDLAGVGDPNILTAGEAWRTRIVASRLSRDEQSLVVARALDAPWSTVAADADLADADPQKRGGLFDRAAKLYWSFSTSHERGIGVAKIHKILHLKRPALYPVLDRRLRTLYAAQAQLWADQLLPDTRRGDSVTYWAAIRDDLVDHGNRAALQGYRNSLRAHDGLTKLAQLTDLRLLDIVAWVIAENSTTRIGDGVVPREHPEEC